MDEYYVHRVFNSTYQQPHSYLLQKCNNNGFQQQAMQQYHNAKSTSQLQTEKTTKQSDPIVATPSATSLSSRSQKLPVPSSSIPFNIDWIYPRLLKPSKWWYVVSEIVIFAVGLFSKIVLVLLNNTHVFNKQRLIDALTKRAPGTPLVTVSNHYSCFDDPGLWGILPLQYVCNTFKIRWSLAAHDICFTNKYHSLFFMYGKCIPVIRGIGVYQDAVNVCIEKMKLGHWVHVFPEGRVNMTKEEMRLKWGVGRIIYESPQVPIILPMWHEGMDKVLPNVEPYRLQWGKKVTLNVGQPIDMTDFIEDMKSRGVKEDEARKLITDKIQNVFQDLRLETEQLHSTRF